MIFPDSPRGRIFNPSCQAGSRKILLYHLLLWLCLQKERCALEHKLFMNCSQDSYGILFALFHKYRVIRSSY